MRRALSSSPSVLVLLAACDKKPAVSPSATTAKLAQLYSDSTGRFDQRGVARAGAGYPRRRPLSPRPPRRGYAVNLEVDPSLERFNGRVTIDIDVAAPTSFVVLNGRDLHITKVTATVGGVTAPRRDGDLARLARRPSPPEELVLSFPTALPAGRGSLALEYDAPFGRELSGLYRVKEGERWYAFTQFEPTAARRAFPCFDEPGAKVPFDLQITTPKGMIAVANTPEASRASTRDAGAVTRFALRRDASAPHVPRRVRRRRLRRTRRGEGPGADSPHHGEGEGRARGRARSR